jgi:hydroxypyruvate reductase
LVIGSNIQALKGCEKKAKMLGFKTFLVSKPITGDNHQAARKLINLVKKIKKQANSPACVICGGETTVKITGKGLGGRNQELVLLCAMNIKKMKNVFILSGSTDGTDGPTDATGAFCDGNTINRAEKKGLDAEEFLKNNDSYHFFKKTKGLLKTKPTGTNVMDIHLILVR